MLRTCIQADTGIHDEMSIAQSEATVVVMMMQKADPQDQGEIGGPT